MKSSYLQDIGASGLYRFGQHGSYRLLGVSASVSADTQATEE